MSADQLRWQRGEQAAANTTEHAPNCATTGVWRPYNMFMKGRTPSSGGMFFVIDVEDRIRADHPLRMIKRVVDEILRELGPLLRG